MNKFIPIIAFILSPFAFGAVSESDRALVEKPRNILANPGFERSTTKWTSSGGTFATTSTAANVGSGVSAGAWDSSAATQTLTSSAVTIPAGLYGSNGVLRCRIQTPTGTATHTVGLWDGSTLSSTTNVVSSSSYVETSVNFVWPSSGTAAIRFTSVNANEPNINIDDCYLGLADNIGTSQIDIPLVSYSPTFSAGFGTVTDSSCQHGRSGDHAIIRCTGTSGTVAASALTISLPTGLTVDSSKVSTNNTIVGTAIWNGSGANGTATIFAVGGASTISIGLQNAGTNQGVSATNGTTFASSQRFSFYATVPITQYNEQTGYRADTYALSWSGYHTGVSSGCERTSSTFGDTTSCTTAAITEKTNRNFGVVTTAAGGLPGIIVTFPRSGRYRVCASPNLSSTSTASDNAVRLVDGSGTIINQGVAWVEGVANTAGSISVCGIYDGVSGVATTLKLQLANGAGTLKITSSGVTGGGTQSAINWDIFALDQGFPAPVILGVRSEVWVTNPTNSSGTTVNRYFSTVQRNEGTGITYATSTTNGDTFTINSPGLYSISYTDSWTTSTSHGVSLNSASLATTIESQPATAALCVANGGARTSSGINCSVTLRLSAGDVLRANTQGAVSGTGAATLGNFHITQVSP